MEPAQEVVDVTLPARDKTTRVVRPRDESLDLPAPTRPTERTAVLRGSSSSPVRRDHFDAVLGLNALEGTLRQTRRALEPAGANMASADVARGVVLYLMGAHNAPVTSNPLALPSQRDTPFRAFEDLASGLRTGRTVAGQSLESRSGPAPFAQATAVPAMPWKVHRKPAHCRARLSDLVIRGRVFWHAPPGTAAWLHPGRRRVARARVGLNIALFTLVCVILTGTDMMVTWPPCQNQAARSCFRGAPRSCCLRGRSLSDQRSTSSRD
jgi:hypothetical protein